MDLLEPGPLTAAGRATLGEEETQVASATGVVLADRAKKPLPLPNDGSGHVAITTHFIWWWPSGATSENGSALKIPLEKVLKAEAHTSMFRRDPRIDIFHKRDPSMPVLRLLFTSGGSTECFKRLQISLERAGWRVPRRSVQREAGFGTQFAGVGGVMRRQEQERAQAKALTTEAFSDLSVLLESASEIVKLADRFSEALRQRDLRGSNSSEQQDFFAMLNDMGIANPATKRACGSRFHEELARELSEFLHRHLLSHTKSGVIALTDLYCLVNRARGTELISPNDLFQACELMSSLELGYHLRTFPSGVSVIQSMAHSDQAIAQRLLAYLQELERQSPSALAALTPLFVAQKQSVSLQLATEQLSTVERMGHLCRDETAHGISFYRNRFAQFA